MQIEELFVTVAVTDGATVMVAEVVSLQTPLEAITL
jgi:hypothetical protein